MNTVQASFTASNISKIDIFSIDLQSRIHDFINTMQNLNQIITRANDALVLTFDSSLSPENRHLISQDLEGRYLLAADTLKVVAEKAASVFECKI